MSTFKKPRRTASRRECALWYSALCLICFVSLLTPIYNSVSPDWLGIPFFMTFQAFLIVVAAVVTLAAYLRGA